jgi:hypothetical protein
MFRYISLSLVFVVIGCAAPRDMHSREDMMKKMDTNRDGMVSKEEFMKHHEEMYDKMKKNKNGMVVIPDGDILGEAGEHSDHTPQQKR